MNYSFYLYSIKMGGKNSNSDGIKINKRKFHASKQPFKLSLVNLDKIVVSTKVKYFVSYIDGDIAKPLCFILPQMSGYIKCSDNGSKNKSSTIKNDDALKNIMIFGVKLKRLFKNILIKNLFMMINKIIWWYGLYNFSWQWGT